MEIGKDKVAAAAAAVLIVLAIAFLASMQKGKPDLVVSVAFSPSQPYAGDVVEFNITVSNNGSAPVNGTIVELEINNHSVAQKSLILAAGETQQVSLDWLADSEGAASIKVNANKGNLADEADLANSIYATSVQVAPAGSVSVFSNLPDQNITSVYEFDATRAGMNQLIGVLASSEQNYSQFYQSIFNYFGEAHLGIAHYQNQSEIAFMYAKPELTREGTRFAFRLIAEEFMGQNYNMSKQVAGRDVDVVTSGDGLVSVCMWQEKGWTRILMYKRYFSEIQVGNMTIGDDTSCEDLVGRQFSPSPALEKLRGVDDLSSAVSLNDSLLLELRAKPGANALYVRGFYDENSAFILMLSTTFDPVQQSCPGELITRGNQSTCNVAQAYIFGNVAKEGFFRRQGGISIRLFIIPFQSTDMVKAREKALDAINSVVFPGIPEYDWSGQGQVEISDCRFPSSLWCSAPKVRNTTLSVNITHAQGHPLQVLGLRCTQDPEEPDYNISLAQPVSIAANQSAEFSFPCYVTKTDPFTGDIFFLRANFYVNYTDLSTNSTQMLKGTIFVNNPPGGG